MNNKGQTLVVFIILLPLILVLIGYAIDKCCLLYEEKKLNNILSIACNYTIDNKNSITEIERLILENDNKIKTIIINKKDIATITLEKEINSIFGNVIGISTYVIKTNVTCTE